MNGSDLSGLPKLAAVEVEGFPGLEGRVRLELDDRCTVLVGKNGAGKSLVVEALARAAFLARTRQSFAQQTGFRCEISRPGLSMLLYEYRQRLGAPVDTYGNGEPAEWSERCWEAEGEELWRIADSTLVLRDRESLQMPPSSGLLSIGDRSFAGVGKEAGLLKQMLAGIHSVPAGLTRGGEGSPRQIVLLPTASTQRAHPGPPTVPLGRLVALMRWIVTQEEQDRPRYEEWVDILCRLGVVKDVLVETYTGRTRNSPDFAAVLFDSVNLGLHADGTLRVAEIIAQLLQKDISCLLLEEPETALHPGLLERLLHMLESYSLDRQLVLTTHAPQVVNAYRPSQLRIVQRNGLERAHPIEAEQLPRVTRYLADGGTLADFLYGFESDCIEDCSSAA